MENNNDNRTGIGTHGVLPADVCDDKNDSQDDVNYHTEEQYSSSAKCFVVGIVGAVVMIILLILHLI